MKVHKLGWEIRKKKFVQFVDLFLKKEVLVVMYVAKAFIPKKMPGIKYCHVWL